MDNALRIAVRASWFVAVVLVLAELIYQLPTSASNEALVFVVLWVLMIPLLRLPDGERKWELLGRGLLGAMVVWILSAIRSQTLGRQPHTTMAFFTAGVIAISVVGSFLQARDDRRAQA